MEDLEDICNLYVEELVEESGLSKIGGICPECNNKFYRSFEGHQTKSKRCISTKYQEIEKMRGDMKGLSLSGEKSTNIKPAAGIPKVEKGKSYLDPVPTQDTKPIANIELVSKHQQIEIVRGDIAKQSLEAVVNAANSQLDHGAGVAGAIRSEGGYRVVEESREWVQKYGQVRPGSVAVTNAGNIRGAKKVIHAVGPMFSSHATKPSSEELRLLQEVIEKALEATNKEKLKSIAIPAISCGIFGGNRFLNEIATTLLSSAMKYQRVHPDTSIRIVRFVLFDEITYRAFEEAHNKLIRNSSSLVNHNGIGGVTPKQLKDTSDIHIEEGEGVGEVYVGPQIHREDVAKFAAAGVILYKFVKGEVRVLLGMEHRLQEGEVLNIPGGKRELGESPEDTAAREFWEETREVIGLDYIKKQLQSTNSKKIWFGPGKYVLFVLKCPDQMSDIDKLHNNKKKGSGIGRSYAIDEMDSLLWVRWDQLVAAARDVMCDSPSYTVRSWRQESVYPLSKFLVRLLRADVLVSAMCDTNIINDMKGDLVERVNLEYSKVEKDLGKPPIHSKNWELKLQLPTAAPVEESPIVTLKPTDKDYVAVMRSLPNGSNGRVISIRKVNVQQRKAEHQSEEKRLGSEITRVVDPTFHGTPDTWRATSIAFKGFDLKLKLNGRACGDGVYTSTDIQTPLGYANNSGSILQLRGLQTQKDYSQNDVIVFRDPKQVLPQFIIDFASVTGELSADGNDMAEQKRKVQEEEDRKRRELEKEVTEIKEKERAFLNAYNQRCMEARTFYFDCLSSIKAELQNATVAGDEEVKQKYSILSRRFENERNQFAALNPIYMEKNSLIHAINEHNVVIVSAATGSGKSTQLPQYIIDDVFSSTETRRVAVLEPRRYNAIGLCNRVSSERSENMGMEVGYSLGQGDVCTSVGTRIEFMTHGLFINRAIKPENVVGTYGAVILDEAHERSVDVDFCFALLRRALAFATETGRLFKVIVASATLSPEQLARYKDFLLPPQLSNKSCVYQVGGSAYPVQIIYRPEAEPNWDEANSMEAASALSSYAVEIAINLIKSSKSDGNILVFMPGESVIDNCISRLSEWSIFKDNDSTTLSSNNNECHTIHLKVNQNSGKESIVAIGLYAFHGKVSEATRKAMETHVGQDRIIIFSTNVAETGLTLPNIRYVIDSGLERRVVWNKATSIREMRTVRITKSSMEQRSGRAGRVASGICVRLYSKETAEQLGEKGPEIESGMILRAVLIKQSMEENSSDEFAMLEEIPRDGLESAQEILRNMSALDENNGITEMGRKLMSLGVDLRLGRFLLACAANGCLRSGSDLVAMITCTNSLSLLPERDRNYNATEFIHPSGDHLTLMNIFQAYENSSKRREFCRSHSIDSSVLEAALRSRENLSATLLRMNLADVDSEDVAQDKSLLTRKLLVSLCAAYFDQVLSANQPGSPKAGFVRVISTEERKAQRAAAAQVAAFGGLGTGSNDDDSALGDDDDRDDNSVISDLTLDTGLDSVTSSDASLKPNLSNYDRVSVPRTSALWNIEKGQNGETDKNEQRLAVYNSVMFTDSRRGLVAHIITYVNEDHVREGASDWYGKSNFASITENLVIKKASFKVSPSLAKLLLRGNLLNRHFNKYMSVNAFVNKPNGELEVSAPAFVLAQMERKLRYLENENGEEGVNIVMDNLSDRKIATLIKFFGRGNVELAEEKKAFVNCLNAKIKSGLGASEGFVEINHNEIGITKNTPTAGSCTIDVRLNGPAKQLATLVVGEVQSEAARQLSCMTELVYDNLASKQIGKLVNRLGKDASESKKEFVKRLDTALQSQGSSKAFEISNIGVQSSKEKADQCTVIINLQHHSKFAPFVIDQTKNEVTRVLAVSTTPNTITEGNGLNYPSIQTQTESNLKINKYLAQLSTTVAPPPSSVTDRNLEMTFIAHAAIWKGKSSVYGGLIRDLLINDSKPNDVDIGYEPDKIDMATLKQIVITAANSINVRLIGEKPKGMAYALTFQGRANPFDVDLVNAAEVRSKSEPPGVDCDVGNMVIQVSGQDSFGMTLKVKDRVSLLPLATSQKHCREKKFVFYYRKEAAAAQARLDKYFRRGWICLSKLEEPLLSWAKSKGYENLLQPKKEFSLPYYSLP